jgi:outer membrane protein assembly factor BamA
MLIKIVRKLGVIGLLVMLFVACNSTKYVPEGEFLLDRVHIKSDNKDLKEEDMNEYLRQTPNNAVLEVLGIRGLRMTLGIYNLRGKDTTNAFNKMIMRVGEPPVIYSPTLTAVSVQQLEKYIQNKGYLLGKVESKVTTRGKKAKVEYVINSNKPYKLHSYKIDLPSDSIIGIVTDSTRTLVQPGSLFDTDVLNQERERIASRLRRRGYYNFNKDLLTFSVDSSLNSKQVDVNLQLRDYVKNSPDSITKKAFKRYKINKVIYNLSPSSISLLDSTKTLSIDTTQFRMYYLISTTDHPLRMDALILNTYIEPNSVYSDRAVEKTYEALNSIGSIKYVNISFKEDNDSMLNCYINVVPSKYIQTTYEAGVTYSGGNSNVNTTAIGGTASVGLIHRNAFKGSESLSVNLKAAVEKMDIWAQEYGGNIGLKFPRFIFPIGSYDAKRKLHASTELTYGYKYQLRPKQFETTLMNGGIQYSWNERYFRHTYQLLNLNYVFYPQIDSKFDSAYLKQTIDPNTKLTTPSKFNPASFENHFIMSMGYMGSYSNYSASRPLQNYTTARYSIESAGSSLYGLSTLLGFPRDSLGVYRLLGVRYSEYLRGEFYITYHNVIDKNNKLVYHFGTGLVVPFANAELVPYEKRFYSGGANSIRGWSEGTLGPGTYRRFSGRMRDFNQVGDVKLEMNMEYRGKIYRWLEGAAFIDAGNVWTIKDYESQAGGAFHPNSFISEIGIAYGLGLRLDFSFFVFRTDVGIKLRDPAQEPNSRWRLSPTFNQDVALQVAIGYPF